jgi:GNAT superfamily N-acetyltransferase
MKTRFYQPSDFAQLMFMGANMHMESDFSPFAFEPYHIRNLERRLLDSPDMCCIVAESDERIVGMFVGGVSEFFFGPDKYGFDLLLYVAPDYRGSSAAYRLVKAAAAFCFSRGAKQLRFGVSTGINPASTDAFYRRLGFISSGVLYTMMA